ncbi:MAG: hypothetical protein ACKVQB_03325 [Bacteroidia bacterium]
MRKSIIILLFIFSTFIFVPESNAQCPMCKTSIESAMKDKNNTKGLGLNNGILYLLSMPYLAVGIVGFIWYRKSKKKQSI